MNMNVLSTLNQFFHNQSQIAMDKLSLFSYFRAIFVSLCEKKFPLGREKSYSQSLPSKLQ